MTSDQPHQESMDSFGHIRMANKQAQEKQAKRGNMRTKRTEVIWAQIEQSGQLWMPFSWHLSAASE